MKTVWSVLLACCLVLIVGVSHAHAGETRDIRRIAGLDWDPLRVVQASDLIVVGTLFWDDKRSTTGAVQRYLVKIDKVVYGHFTGKEIEFFAEPKRSTADTGPLFLNLFEEKKSSTLFFLQKSKGSDTWYLAERWMGAVVIAGPFDDIANRRLKYKGVDPKIHPDEFIEAVRLVCAMLKPAAKLYPGKQEDATTDKTKPEASNKKETESDKETKDEKATKGEEQKDAKAPSANKTQPQMKSLLKQRYAIYSYFFSFLPEETTVEKEGQNKPDAAGSQAAPPKQNSTAGNVNEQQRKVPASQNQSD